MPSIKLADDTYAQYSFSKKIGETVYYITEDPIFGGKIQIFMNNGKQDYCERVDNELCELFNDFLARRDEGPYDNSQVIANVVLDINNSILDASDHENVPLLSIIIDMFCVSVSFMNTIIWSSENEESYNNLEYDERIKLVGADIKKEMLMIISSLNDVHDVLLGYIEE